MRDRVGMARYIIIALTAIATIVLFRAMHHELAAPSEETGFIKPLEAGAILASLRATEQSCDAVDTFMPLGKSNLGWDAYLARCHDGGRYVFFQNTEDGKAMIKSCAEEAELGYRCPP